MFLFLSGLAIVASIVGLYGICLSAKRIFSQFSTNLVPGLMSEKLEEIGRIAWKTKKMDVLFRFLYSTTFVLLYGWMASWGLHHLHILPLRWQQNMITRPSTTSQRGWFFYFYLPKVKREPSCSSREIGLRKQNFLKMRLYFPRSRH